MQQPTRRVAVLRLSGDISTKSNQTRKWFTARLVSNIRAGLRLNGIDFELVKKRDRIFVYSQDPKLGPVLSRVFGVAGVGIAEPHTYETLDDVVQKGLELFSDKVVGRTFAVRSRRCGEKSAIPFMAIDLDQRLGGALYPLAKGVDLKSPEFKVQIEVHETFAYHYVEPEYPGNGGLPLGVQDRALCLISGGFDSAVAAWQMMRRGVALDFVFFNLAGAEQVRGVRRVLQKLLQNWSYGHEAKLLIVDLRPAVGQLKLDIKGTYWQVVLKRLMARAADLIAQQQRYAALLTGEALGQVSTQALATMAPIATGIKTPILRPLVGFNKDEIIKLSKHVGTHDISAKNPEFCALGGGRPVTKIATWLLDKLEAEITGIPELVAEAQTLDFETLLQDPEDVGVGVNHIPDGAAVIDLRSDVAYSSWHFPGSANLPFDVAVKNALRLPKDRAYVFYCEVGLKSASLAERLHELGYEAYNFDGALRGLMRWAAEHRLGEANPVDEF